MRFRTDVSLLLLALFIGAGVFSMSVAPVEAVALAELQQIIEQLKTQIAELQARLELVRQGATDPGQWCHTFNTNLKYGDKGAEVAALQTALEKQGFRINENESSQSYFGEFTASAVVGFQEKYRKEVLSQYGLIYGTGFVGKTTRAKLNHFYGYGATPPIVKPYIKVLSPNGGEEWVVGNTYRIIWSSVGINKVTIELMGLSVRKTIAILEDNHGYYNWNISSDISPSDKYIIRVHSYELSAGDDSDKYFSIVSADETCHTSPLGSWDYCSPGCKCYAGEGDCDTDADCFTGYCAQNVGRTKYDMDMCEEKAAITCTDSDGGKDYYVKGTVTGLENGQMVTSTDGCGYDNETLAEVYCDGNNLKVEQYICPNGCENGACVRDETTPSITVISPNGGEEWVKGTTTYINLKFLPSVPLGGFVVNLIRSDRDETVSHLKYCGTSADYTQDGATPSNVSWSWKIGYAADEEEIPAGSYRIFVYSCGSKIDNVWTGGVTSEKSNIFSIIEEEDWQVYQNQEHKYSFEYSADCFYGPMPVYCKENPPRERPAECLCFLNGENNDNVFMQDFIDIGEDKDLVLATFSIYRVSVSWYNPQPGTDLTDFIEWHKEKFPSQDFPNEVNMEIDGVSAVKIYTPFSGMAYSSEEIYFIKDNNLFRIGMIDVDNEDIKELYDKILSSFKFLE